MGQDIRYALRILAKSPGFTAVAVLSLAIGIGANATLFTWISGVLLRPLPGAAHADRLVALSMRNTAQDEINSLSYPDYEDLRRGTALDGLVVYDDQAMSLSADGRAERIWGLLVSGDYFDVLGVTPRLGRGFLPEEGRVPGAHPVLVISYALWQRRFAGDPAVVGRSVTLNEHPFTIVGVAPASFQGTVSGLSFDAYVPLMMQDQMTPAIGRLERRGDRWLQAMALLKPGLGMREARAQMEGLARQLARAHPDTNEGMSAELFPLWRPPFGAATLLGPVLMVLAGVVAFVLLIACANLANLLLARGMGRRREIAVRLSLGAGRARLVRQMLTESLVLALLGGAAGVAVAYWGAGLLTALVPPTDYPVGLPVGVDARALAFTLLVSLLTGLVFGLAPALQASRPELAAALKEETGAVAGGRRKARLNNLLVIAQVSLCLVLLVAAGLLIRSLRNARSVDVGFDPKRVLLASLDMFPSGYTPERGRIFLQQALERLAALPGVESVSCARRFPLGFGGASSTTFDVDGYTPPAKESAWANYTETGPEYLATLRIGLVRGREFSARDNAGAPLVVLVNETMARRYWPGRDAVGGRLRLGKDWLSVIGVAKDIKYRDLDERPAPHMYLPVLQQYRPDTTLAVRASGDPLALAPAVREAVRSLDPHLPVFGMATLESHIGAAAFPQRLGGLLLGGLGAVGLSLACLGLYGVLAYSVGQRSRELAIRMALGGTQREIFRLVVRQGLRLTSLGIAAGLAGALAATRMLSSLLVGVSPTDVGTFVGVTTLLVGVALVACAIPARRATRIDPIRSLRYE